MSYRANRREKSATKLWSPAFGLFARKNVSRPLRRPCRKWRREKSASTLRSLGNDSPPARPRSMLAQSLRCSKRHAVPRGRSGRASPKSYCSPAVNAGGSFQRLIGAIIVHEGIVNFVEIGGIIFHGNFRKIPSPLIWYILQGFGTMTYVTQRGVPILVGAKLNATAHGGPPSIVPAGRVRRSWNVL